VSTLVGTHGDIYKSDRGGPLVVVVGVVVVVVVVVAVVHRLHSAASEPAQKMKAGGCTGAPALARTLFRGTVIVKCFFFMVS
jgi:preprotein translocase subunit SecG